MPILKRTLLLMLVLCTLGYSTAWAYDGHAIELSDDSLIVLDVAAVDGNVFLPQNAEQPPVADVDCDHCCHISAHLMAIFSQNGYLCSMHQSSELLEFSEIFVSYIVSPDLRPPRV